MADAMDVNLEAGIRQGFAKQGLMKTTGATLETLEARLAVIRMPFGSAVTQQSVIIKRVGDNMIRTQISLEKKDYDLAKKHAGSLGISVAEFVRRAVREKLPAEGKALWMQYSGFVSSGNPQSSQSIDELVYGSKD